jgi:hypothetical protein
MAKIRKIIRNSGRKWPKMEKSTGIPVENDQNVKNCPDFW